MKWGLSVSDGRLREKTREESAKLPIQCATWLKLHGALTPGGCCSQKIDSSGRLQPLSVAFCNFAQSSPLYGVASGIRRSCACDVCRGSHLWGQERTTHATRGKEERICLQKKISLSLIYLGTSSECVCVYWQRGNFCVCSWARDGKKKTNVIWTQVIPLGHLSPQCLAALDLVQMAAYF